MPVNNNLNNIIHFPIQTQNKEVNRNDDVQRKRQEEDRPQSPKKPARDLRDMVWAKASVGQRNKHQPKKHTYKIQQDGISSAKAYFPQHAQKSDNDGKVVAANDPQVKQGFQRLI